MTGNGDSNRSSSSLGNYDDNDDNSERKRIQPAATTTTPQSVDGSKTTISLASSSSSSFLELENKISKEVPRNRRDEIYEFIASPGYIGYLWKNKESTKKGSP